MERLPQKLKMTVLKRIGQIVHGKEVVVEPMPGKTVWIDWPLGGEDLDEKSLAQARFLVGQKVLKPKGETSARVLAVDDLKKEKPKEPKDDAKSK